MDDIENQARSEYENQVRNDMTEERNWDKYDGEQHEGKTPEETQEQADERYDVEVSRAADHAADERINT